jgi:hypothetical protein
MFTDMVGYTALSQRNEPLARFERIVASLAPTQNNG